LSACGVQQFWDTGGWRGDVKNQDLDDPSPLTTFWRKLCAMIGETFGNYRIVRRLGSGAMGTVFLGEHERIARSAAIKVLAPEFAVNSEILGRFFDEARATSLIRHPAIVEILDCGVHPSGQPYITMEYLEGQTLAEVLERVGAIPWPQACAVAIQIAGGLGAAHRHRIVHRDVKPANVMRRDDPEAPPDVGPAPRIKVLDFGVAKLLQDSRSGVRTHPGKLLGTPEYMSPEQCGGEGTIDARTDIYALGCVLYEMVSGNPPFPVDNLNDVIVAHRWREPPAAASAADVPLALDRLIARMLAKRQEHRPAGMDEVARGLSEVLERPNDAVVDKAPNVTKSASTRPGRPEGPAPARAKSQLARRRSLAVTLGAAGLVIVTIQVARVAHRGPRREAAVVATAGALVQPPVIEAATPPMAATRALAATRAVAATTPTPARASSPLPAVKSAPPPSPAASRRRARGSSRVHTHLPTNVDADGIVNL
jgi:serine/threonine-protein kinase